MSRYNQFPTYVEQVIGVMRAGIAKNMTNHAVSMEVIEGHLFPTLSLVESFIESEVPHLRLFLVETYPKGRQIWPYKIR